MLLHAYNAYSPRLRRAVVLCGIALLVALFLGRTELQGSSSLPISHQRIFARSESSVLDIRSSNETATRLYKRDPLTEAEWEKAVKTGASFVTCVLKAKNDKDSGYPKQSIWLDPDALAQNGWSTETTKGDGSTPLASTDTNALGNIRAVLSDLGLLKKVQPGDIVNIQNTQNEGYTVQIGGQPVTFESISATQGFYTSTMIAKTGVFIAENNQSPANVLAEDVQSNNGDFEKGQMPPELSAWSDVTFLQWSQTADKVRGGISFFFRFHIINEATMQIIDRALDSQVPLTTISATPQTLLMTTEGGRAILGSPNGKGIGFFLSQHKEQLGLKTVESVTVFTTQGKSPETSEPEAWYQAYFKIIDVPK